MGPIREGAVFDLEGNIYIASYDEKIYSFSPYGDLRCTVKTNGGMYSACSLWKLNDKLVCTIGSKDGFLYTIDAGTGKIIWKIGIGPVSIGAMVGNMVWITTDDNRLLSITPEGQIYFLKDFEEIYYSSPAIFNGKIVVANDEEKIYLIPYIENIRKDIWPVYRANLQRTGELKP